MIGSGAIGTRGVGLPRWLIVAGSINLTVSVVISGGGAAVVSAVKSSVFSGASAGGGAASATARKGSALSVVATGGGSATVSFEPVSFTPSASSRVLVVNGEIRRLVVGTEVRILKARV